MKSLYLLRHAKSSWVDPLLADFDRPLNPRGREAAPLIGTYLRDHGLVPDLALCSAAERAKETWDLAAVALGAAVPVKTYRSIYLASPSRLLGLLRRQSDDVSATIMIGHHPGMARLAQRLAGPGSAREALMSLEAKYPTAGLAVLEFEARPWADLAEASGRLTRFVRPKDLA